MNEPMNVSSSQTIPLSIFCFFMTVFGIFGNGTVIYASVRFNALKLDKVSLLFIQNLAVADVIYTVVSIFPSFVTYSSGGWVLGKGWCFVQAQLAFVPGFANSMLVLIITLYRLVLFTIPLQAITQTSAVVFVVVIWGIAILTPAILNGYCQTHGVFQPGTGACISSVYEEARIAVLIVSVVLVLLPIVFITLTNVVICSIAIRHSSRKKQRSKNVFMVCLLSGTFVLSWLPQVVSNLAMPWFPHQPNEVYILAYNCIFINSFVNPVLYSLTNYKFRKYVFESFRKWFGLKQPNRSVEIFRMRT